MAISFPGNDEMHNPKVLALNHEWASWSGESKFLHRGNMVVQYLRHKQTPASSTRKALTHALLQSAYMWMLQWHLKCYVLSHLTHFDDLMPEPRLCCHFCKFFPMSIYAGWMRGWGTVQQQNAYLACISAWFPSRKPGTSKFLINQCLPSVWIKKSHYRQWFDGILKT